MLLNHGFQRVAHGIMEVKMGFFHFMYIMVLLFMIKEVGWVIYYNIIEF